MSTNANFYNELTGILDISGIVHNEQARLDKKATGIKTALSSQNRIILLNQSYASRMKEYSFMIMIIAMTIVTIVSILVIKDILPASLVNILIVLVGGGGGIWALYIYYGIQQRDNVDFDKIYSTPPKSAMDTSGNAFTDNINAGNISYALGLTTNDVCTGNSCCPPNFVYSSDLNVCVPIQPFTSMQQAYSSGDYKGNALPSNTVYTNNLLTFSSYP